MVKLKDFSASPTPPKPKLKKKISVDEDGQGYMASLVAKILNNMSVICNNIVLKFIEEDIVISMNIQHLSIHSADHRWKRAFIDVSPSVVLFRKLINIIDFTICLDKRNSSGKIEYVQEPILYKCSMELRLYRKYNANAPGKLSLTRIDVQTNSLNLNISSQQFPMLLRLYDLIMALKSGRLQAKYAENLQTQPATDHDEQGDDESWLLWAWNMIPAILPDEQSDEPQETTDKKVFEFGFYAEEIILMLKAQEFLSDPIIPSTKKAVFKPLMSIRMQEYFVTTIISGVRKFNVKSGIGFAEVIALEECTCGSYVTDPQLLTVGSREKTGNYLKDSFMDKSAATMQSKYENMWSNYYEKNSEEVMLSKTPAIALDILHSVEIPDDAKSSDVGSDLEFSNLSESYVIRVFGNGMVMSAGAEMIHRVEKLVQYYKDCDFLPYVEEDKPLQKNQLSPATADDYDALIAEVPMKIVQMKLRNSIVLVKEWEHERQTKAVRKFARQGSCSGIVQKKSVQLEMKIDEATMELKNPLYKNRLLYTACQLPDNIENELFDKCFLTVKATLKNINVDMKFDKQQRICEFLSVSTSMKRIIYPHLWTEKDIKENNYEAIIDGFSLMINPAQLLALKSILSSLASRTIENELEMDVLRNLERSDFVVVQLSIQKLRASLAETISCYFAKLLVSDVLGIAWKSGSKSLIINWPDTTAKPDIKTRKLKKKIDELLVVQLQMPKTSTEPKLIPVITLKFSEGSINLDPLFREFLSFEVLPDEAKTERFLRTISTSTKPAFNQSSNNQLPSVHSSSDCDITICPQNPDKDNEKEKKDLFGVIEAYKNFIVNVEVKPVTIYNTMVLMESSKPSDSLGALLSKCDGVMFVLKMPNILFHSVKNKSMSEMVSTHFTVDLPSNLWGNEKASTWNLELGNLTAYSMDKGKIYNLIEDLSLNISIADETPANSAPTKVFTGNLLIETSPVTVSIHTSQVMLIKSSIDQVMNFPLISHFKKVESVKLPVEKSLAVIEESPQNTTDIKEFLGLANGSTTTKTSQFDDQNKSKEKAFSLFFA